MSSENVDEKSGQNAAATRDREKLRDYYARFNIDLEMMLDQYGEGEPRFVRLNPRFDKADTIKMIKTELPAGSEYPKLVSWMDSASAAPTTASWEFYSLPATFKVAQSRAYKAGRIYGQDVSSGAAVAVLMEPPTTSEPNTDSSKTSEQILDLCCAPGLKLCAILDWLEKTRPAGQLRDITVVGVDLSEDRLGVAKNVIQKYHIDPKTSGERRITGGTALPRIRLYNGDGTTFGMTPRKDNLCFDSEVAREEQMHMGERKRKNKSSKAREKKRLKLLQGLDFEESSTEKCSPFDGYFDRVLVDAECSTDGSLKHVVKALNDSSKPRVGGILSCLTDNDKMNELVNLQMRLALRGFRLLRPGGCMVYATCSLSERQNEDVVSHILACNEDARVDPISVGAFGQSQFIKLGSIKGTVRFMPNVGSDDQYGGGFFLARIKKAQSVPTNLT
ncbi:hypothetical protein ACA910_005290 [Epithemia clementina (nom. ined.)]